MWWKKDKNSYRVHIDMGKIDNCKSEAMSQNMGEIVLYHPDETVRLDVMVEDETVWLTQAQMADLFQTTKQNVSLHVNNAFSEGELERISVVKEYLTTAADGKNYRMKHYNLDVIISVGYRVKSLRGTTFRRWATKVLKEYMLKGFVINQRFEQIEQRVAETEKKIDFLVKTSLVRDDDRLRNEIIELKQYIESILADYNDINEDTRTQFELIHQALAELQTKIRLIEPRNPTWN